MFDASKSNFSCIYNVALHNNNHTNLHSENFNTKIFSQRQYLQLKVVNYRIHLKIKGTFRSSVRSMQA